MSRDTKAKTVRKLKSRSVDKSRPMRAYKCPGCEQTWQLYPGCYWHTCEGYEWRLDDVVLSAYVESAVSSLTGVLSRLGMR